MFSLFPRMEYRLVIPRYFAIPSFAVWVLLLIGSVYAGFAVEKNSVTVLAPPELRSKHDGSVANFGVPAHGGFIVGSVAYPQKGAFGCEPFEGDKPFKFRNRPTVLLLDRGECFFAKKVWHAQQAGAIAVLVADAIDEPLITMETPEQSLPDGEYIEKIRIPSILIQKSFSDMLKKALNKNKKEVVVKLNWRESSFPHPDNRVEYKFWTNSDDKCGSRCDEQTNFARNFKSLALKLYNAILAI